MILFFGCTPDFSGRKYMFLGSKPLKRLKKRYYYLFDLHFFNWLIECLLISKTFFQYYFFYFISIYVKKKFLHFIFFLKIGTKKPCYSIPNNIEICEVRNLMSFTNVTKICKILYLKKKSKATNKKINLKCNWNVNSYFFFSPIFCVI